MELLSPLSEVPILGGGYSWMKFLSPPWEVTNGGGVILG